MHLSVHGAWTGTWVWSPQSLPEVICKQWNVLFEVGMLQQEERKAGYTQDILLPIWLGA